MTSAVYPKYKQACMSGGANTDLIAGNLKLILVDLADYTYAATHEFLTDVPAAARVAISGNLTGKSVTDGTVDFDNVTWSAVTGDQSEAFILFVDTGVEATSRLVHFADAASSGLPVTPNSGDINFNVNNAGHFTL
ncbi:hypothetical protein LCM27_01815 [Ruegeria marisrubri]|uniref:hypothetical protein n=1 Tax=Ruegeria marisrubri TaxID=1685379 RepID=UPI001CD3514B|nr:hypothetical protein [Ruegeria marisrubri]MCA0905129.1 hypothetical protein [Ruegeria marisrubri]